MGAIAGAQTSDVIASEHTLHSRVTVLHAHLQPLVNNLSPRATLSRSLVKFVDVRYESESLKEGCGKFGSMKQIKFRESSQASASTEHFRTGF